MIVEEVLLQSFEFNPLELVKGKQLDKQDWNFGMKNLKVIKDVLSHSSGQCFDVRP